MPIIVDHSAGDYALRNITAGLGQSVEKYRTNQLDKAANQRAERGMTLQEMAFQRLLGRDERSDFESDRGFNESQRQFDQTFDYRQGRDQIGDARYDDQFGMQQERFRMDKARNAVDLYNRVEQAKREAISFQMDQRINELQAKALSQGLDGQAATMEYLRGEGQKYGMNFPKGMDINVMRQELQRGIGAKSALDTITALSQMVGPNGMPIVSEQSLTMLTEQMEAGDYMGAMANAQALAADASDEMRKQKQRAEMIPVVQGYLDSVVKRTDMTEEDASFIASQVAIGAIQPEQVFKIAEEYTSGGNAEGASKARGGAPVGFTRIKIGGRDEDVPESAFSANNEPIRPGSAAAGFWYSKASSQVQGIEGESDDDYRNRIWQRAEQLAEGIGGWETSGWRDAAVTKAKYPGPTLGEMEPQGMNAAMDRLLAAYPHLTHEQAAQFIADNLNMTLEQLETEKRKELRKR